MFSIIQKGQDVINVEDLDLLQTEIESSLVNVMQKKWQLESDLQILAGKSIISQQGNQPVNSNHNNSTNSINLRKSHNLSSASSASSNCIVSSDNSVESSPRTTDDRPSKRSKVESPTSYNKLAFRTPDKFWPFVEQFCAAPTTMEIERLRSYIDEKNCKSNSALPKTPNKSTPDEKACLGALTQRLVSCLIEENMNSFDEMEAELGLGANMTGNNKKSHKFRNLHLGNVKLLEKRIRTTLEEHHILTKQDDISFGSEDDDVLRELRCCQNELSLIQTYNKEAMVSLIARAKRRAELDEMREKLKIANADVIDSYQKLILAKQKKRNPTKKEKDAAWKAIEEQEAIFRRCEDLSINL